jgi:hypothetical protein
MTFNVPIFTKSAFTVQLFVKIPMSNSNKDPSKVFSVRYQVTDKRKNGHKDRYGYYVKPSFTVSQKKKV